MQVDEMKTARPAKPAVVAHQSNLIGHSRATQISAAADNNIAGLSQAGGGAGGHVPTQFLADQLTYVNQGGHIIPTTLLLAPPRIFRPCEGPA